MSLPSLKGHRILIAEDEPIVALDLAASLEVAGASTIVVHTLADAIAVARKEALSAAVVDMKLRDELASPLCALLQYRDVPFVVYTGYEIPEFKFNSLIIPKPAPQEKIVEKLSALSRPIERSSTGTDAAPL